MRPLHCNNKIGWWNTQRIREPPECTQRRLPTAALQQADKSSVDLGIQCQGLLGQTCRTPFFPEYRTKCMGQLICLCHIGRFRRLRLRVYGL